MILVKYQVLKYLNYQIGLRTNFRDYNTVSRFRWGAEARSTESWRGSAVCRMCNEKEESMDHLVECFPVEGSRNGKDLWCKDSGGKEWMLNYVAERNHRMWLELIFNAER